MLKTLDSIGLQLLKFCKLLIIARAPAAERGRGSRHARHEGRLRRSTLPVEAAVVQVCEAQLSPSPRVSPGHR
jgi:hypothetical protein